MLYAPGINCHEETAFSVDYAGGQGEIVLLADLLEGRRRLDDYVGLVIPGGFSYGDHLAAGRVLAIHLIARLKEELRAFTASGRPVLGICNGDQILMETGLLPNGNVGERASALTQNRSARFESRWVRLQADSTSDVAWRRTACRRAHGEGRCTPDAAYAAFLLADLRAASTEEFPDNPATSPGGIAGLVDPLVPVLG